MKLGSCVMAQSNQKTITAFKKELIDTPLAGWIEYIESNKAHLNVIDADSVQSFLDELIEKYGEVDHKLCKDLIGSEDQRFNLLMHSAKQFKSNNK